MVRKGLTDWTADASMGCWMKLGSQGSQRETVVFCWALVGKRKRTK